MVTSVSDPTPRSTCNQNDAFLEDIMGDRQSVAEDLKKTITGRTRPKQAVKQLAVDCESDAKLLLEVLRKMKAKGQRLAGRV